MDTKPGVKTSEFWVTAAAVLAAICTGLIAALKDRTDSVSTAVVAAAGVISAALAAMGYSHSRAITKAAAAGSDSPAPPEQVRQKP